MFRLIRYTQQCTVAMPGFPAWGQKAVGLTEKKVVQGMLTLINSTLLRVQRCFSNLDRHSMPISSTHEAEAV